MSFTLNAPFPGVQTSSVLPNPQFGNSEGRVQEINVKRSISGNVRTYVTRGTMPNGKLRSKMQWNFVLTRNKAIELLEFVNAYHSSQIQVFDHAGREYRGFIMNNPLEISPVRRGAPGAQGLPGELCEVSIEFEGEAFLPPRPPIVWSASARNDLELFQIPTQIPGYPNVYGLIHHWDAWDLASSVPSGDRFQLWNPTVYASSPVALEKHPTGNWPWGPWDRYGPMDYSPYLYTGFIGPGLPAVYTGGSITNGSVLAGSTLRSNANVTFASSAKVGTIIFVYAHTHGNAPGSGLQWFQTGTEINVWNIRRASDNFPTEGFGIVGGLGDWEPGTYRLTCGSGDLGNPRLHNSTNFDRAVLMQRGRPYINTLIRNGTRLRYRMNGVELDGRTNLLSCPSTTGRFVIGGAGAYQMSSNHWGARGWLGEFLVYHRELSASELEQVETYLSEKWAIPYEYLWEHEEQCFADWCVSMPHFCTNYPGGTIAPSPLGLPKSDWAPANIQADTPANYYRTCCEGS